jgi:hypothetical protein
VIKSQAMDKVKALPIMQHLPQGVSNTPMAATSGSRRW